MNSERSERSARYAELLVGWFEPTDEALATFAAPATLDQPVRMLTMLRFRDRSTSAVNGDDALEDRASSDALDGFGEFAEMLGEQLAAVGARSVFYAEAEQIVIGHPDERWDLVSIIEYPSRQAWLEVVNGADFQALEPQRIAGLADMRLVVMPS